MILEIIKTKLGSFLQELAPQLMQAGHAELKMALVTTSFLILDLGKNQLEQWQSYRMIKVDV